MDVVVRVSRRGRGTVLVQWEEGGMLRRGWLPASSVSTDSRVSSDELGAAAPYGLDIARAIGDVQISAEQVEDAFHRRGLWTKEDILNNANDVARALLSCCGLSASRVQTKVREFLEEDNGSASND